MKHHRAIRVLALLEADFVSGPAKNLLDFSACLQRDPSAPVQLEIAVFHRHGPDNDFTHAAGALGVPLHRIPERFAFDLQVIPRIREIIQISQPDILQSHAVKSHFLLRLGGEWRRRPWVAFHHGYTRVNTKMLLYNQLDRWSLQRPKRLVTVSRPFVRQLEETGVPASRITVLHNAIDPSWGSRATDPDLRRQTRASLGIRDEEKVVLNVGRLSREKCQSLLVESFSLMRQLVPGQPVRLLIVGEGHERAAIEQAIRKCGLSEGVILAGYSRDVAPYYAAADVAVIASETEGSPNALLEALAARLPLVATTVGGIPEMVSEETAWLIPPRDASSLCRAMTEVISQAPVAQTRVARASELLLRRFTPQARADALCQIYQQAVAS